MQINDFLNLTIVFSDFFAKKCKLRYNAVEEVEP